MSRQPFPGLSNFINSVEPRAKRRLCNLILLCAALSFCQSALYAATATDIDSDNRAREAELTQEFRKSQGNASSKAATLLELALVRERLGKWREALAALDSLKKQYGTVKPENFASSAPQYTGKQLADFFSRRVQRKQNQKPVVLSRETKFRVAQGVDDWLAKGFAVDQLDLLMQADLDGDSIEEVFYIGSNGPLGKRKKDTMGILKWDGNSYRKAWERKGRIPFMVRELDQDNDGWKELFFGYTPDSDDAATLYFNGKDVLFR